jgi:hypothetical protein
VIIAIAPGKWMEARLLIAPAPGFTCWGSESSGRPLVPVPSRLAGEPVGYSGGYSGDTILNFGLF